MLRGCYGLVLAFEPALKGCVDRCKSVPSPVRRWTKRAPVDMRETPAV